MGTFLLIVTTLYLNGNLLTSVSKQTNHSQCAFIGEAITEQNNKNREVDFSAYQCVDLR